MKTEEKFRFFLRINDDMDPEHFEYGRNLIERIPTEDICKVYFIGGLYDKEEVDEWKENGADPDDMPLPVADETSWESTYEEEKEFYELVDGEFVLVTAGEQNEGEEHCWWNGSNFKYHLITSDIGGLSPIYVAEITDDIESFEEIWDDYNGQGYGHEEIWKAVFKNGETKFYNRSVSYWQGDYNEYYYEISEDEAEKMMSGQGLGKINIREKLEKINPETLPVELKKLYPSITKKVEFYNDSDTIKKLIDTYVVKVNKYLAQREKQTYGKKTPTKKQDITKTAKDLILYNDAGKWHKFNFKNKKDKIAQVFISYLKEKGIKIISNPDWKKGRSVNVLFLSYKTSKFELLDNGAEFKMREISKDTENNEYYVLSFAEFETVVKIADKIAYIIKTLQLRKKNELTPDKKTPSKTRTIKMGPKQPQTEKKQTTAMQVAKLSPEIRFIKRYVLMNGKKKTRKQLLNFINSLQRSIEKKEIRKTSKYAKEIMHIQNELIKIYNDPDVGNTFTFKLDKSDNKVMEKYREIAGSEKQRVSVRLISRYIGIHGQTAVKEKAERLLKAIKNAFSKKQITNADPYYKELKKVEKNLTDYIKSKEAKLTINTVDLKGLQGIAGIAVPDKKKTMCTKSKGKTIALNGIITAREFADYDYKTFGFKGKWLNLIGDPSIPFYLMFWSKPGLGKSTLAIELSKYLADKFNRKVLFVAAEEGLSYTLKDKFKRLNAFDDNIFILPEIPPTLDQYDVIVIDSVTRLKMQPQEFVKLKEQYPEKTFILVFQSTVDGNYRGNKEWEHEVDVSIYINENGYASAQKTRFGGTGTIKVFAGKTDPIYKFSLLQDAEKFVSNRKDEKLRIVQGDDGKYWVTNPDKANELKNLGYQIY